MDNSAIDQKLKLMLLPAAGLFLAVILGASIGRGNYAPIFSLGVLLGVTCLVIFSGRFYWVLTIASSFLGGTFPILGGSFTPFQVLMAFGVLRFLGGDVVLRRTRFVLGDRIDLLMIVGFMGVIFIHGLHDRFGMRFLGSSVWGGANYVNVLVGLAAFFVIQSIPVKPGVWTKLPFAILAVTAFDLTIALITTFFPASIFKIYPFYSAVSRTGIEEIVTGNAVETARVGSFGNIGFTLIVLVLASVSLREIFHLSNLYRLIALCGGFIGGLISSFRTSVVNSMLVVLVAGIRDLKWGVLAIVPLLAALLFAISAINSQIVSLPDQVQRSLAFVPGKWDPRTKADATASNDFRKEVWLIWEKDYFPLQPWFGRGFGFRSEWAAPSVYQYDPSAYVQMVEVGNIHNGFFSALDTFGILGTIFFVIWNLRILYRALRTPFLEKHSDATPLRFLALYLAVSILFFWIGAANIGTFLPRQFALVGVFLQLRRTVMSSQVSPVASPALTPSLPAPRTVPT